MPSGRQVRHRPSGSRTTVKPWWTQGASAEFQISSKLSGQAVHAVWDETSVVFADPNGEVLIEHPWPPKGTTYVSNGIRRGSK